MGHQRCSIIVEIKPTPSQAAIFGTNGPGNLALDPHTITPHRTSDGYLDISAECQLGGQAHPRCEE